MRDMYFMRGMIFPLPSGGGMMDALTLYEAFYPAVA